MNSWSRNQYFKILLKRWPWPLTHQPKCQYLVNLSSWHHGNHKVQENKYRWAWYLDYITLPWTDRKPNRWKWRIMRQRKYTKDPIQVLFICIASHKPHVSIQIYFLINSNLSLQWFMLRDECISITLLSSINLTFV